ncbi:MAG: carbohydrate kinase family protein [Lachnospiraceae bacterium]|nr:carbohydrate kinase family protein [Lachnospiraceae bacterium]
MQKKVIVAGHICIDITPAMKGRSVQDIGDYLSPGKLINVGSADIHTGGVVANTGLAMKLLGADVSLAGKIGDDSFGSMIESIVSVYGAEKGLIKKKGESTSYSIVLAIPGVDRIFLHNPGANDTFTADDIPADLLNDAALFHFGYPPIMKKMYENDGEELARVMKLARDAGAATSLDLSAVDPDSEAGKADWKKILSKVLPLTDIFVPSIEELAFMLDRDMYMRVSERAGNKDFTSALSLDKDIIPLAEQCLNMGTGIILIKCGAPGMYYHTAGEERIKKISGRAGLDAAGWAGKSGFEKSFKPERILSGTGAGDTSAAAFLTSLLNGCPVEKCAVYAAATGACCVTGYDALSGLKSFDEIDKMISSGWEKTKEELYAG